MAIIVANNKVFSILHEALLISARELISDFTATLRRQPWTDLRLLSMFICCFVSPRAQASPQFLSCRSAKKTVPDVYVGNLAVADLVHVTVMPFLIHQWARGGHWVFGSSLCTIITSLDNCNQVACAAVMTAMSLDRWICQQSIYFTVILLLDHFNYLHTYSQIIIEGITRCPDNLL